MRIAVTGKGGAGKSTISGALSRQFARQGHKVVAVDADPNPNLGISLGVQPSTVESMRPILNALIDSGHTHNDPMPRAEDLLDRYGIGAPEGITLVATGKIERPTDACLCCGSHNTTRQFFGDLTAGDRIVVADLEAGLNDLIWARPGPDDVVVVVTETSAKSFEIARRAVALAQEMGVQRIIGVANRAAPGLEPTTVADRLGVREVVVVPEDPALERADHLGMAAMDNDPTSPAMLAIADLAIAVVAEQLT
ncbi:MAG: AAA family ATPase [Actinomycetota bacterium]|nr:AAA family ATPase [Actinomycetota bacterium]